METKITLISGSLAGVLTQALLGNIFVTLSIAFMTGAASYGGQQFFKWLHKKIKRK